MGQSTQKSITLKMELSTPIPYSYGVIFSILSIVCGFGWVAEQVEHVLFFRCGCEIGIGVFYNFGFCCSDSAFLN